MIMALMDTDLPDPVVPPMSRCGILARSDTMRAPSTSLPMAICSGPSGASLMHVAQKHGLPRAVGHLDAHVVRAGDGREDAHARRGERERDVVLERRDAAHAHAGGQVHLEQRDRGAGHPAHHLGEYAESSRASPAGTRPSLSARCRRRCPSSSPSSGQKVHRGQLEAVRGARRGQRTVGAADAGAFGSASLLALAPPSQLAGEHLAGPPGSPSSPARGRSSWVSRASGAPRFGRDARPRLRSAGVAARSSRPARAPPPSWARRALGRRAASSRGRRGAPPGRRHPRRARRAAARPARAR